MDQYGPGRSTHPATGKVTWGWELAGCTQADKPSAIYPVQPIPPYMPRKFAHLIA
jgi:hypothetical protein